MFRNLSTLTGKILSIICFVKYLICSLGILDKSKLSLGGEKEINIIQIKYVFSILRRKVKILVIIVIIILFLKRWDKISTDKRKPGTKVQQKVDF